MLVRVQTDAGTISEANQDVFISREEDGISVLANGNGLNGREAAQEIAGSLMEKLWEIRLKASVDASAERFTKALREVYSLINDWRVNRPGFQNVSIDLAATCMVEGNLLLGISNTCGAIGLIGGKAIRLDPVVVRTIPGVEKGGYFAESPELSVEPTVKIQGPFPISVGDWVMLFSEGLLMSQPLGEVIGLIPAVQDDSERMVQGLFQRASNRYDGDDRTLVFLRFLPQDLRGLLSDDVPIDTEVDKTFPAPMWMAFLLFFITSVVGWFFYRLGFLDDD